MEGAEKMRQRWETLKLSKSRSQCCVATALGEEFAERGRGGSDSHPCWKCTFSWFNSTAEEQGIYHIPLPLGRNSREPEQALEAWGAASRNLETTAKEARQLTFLEAGSKMAFPNLFISVAVMAGAFLSSDLSKKKSLHLLLVHLCSFSATFYRQGNNCRKRLSFSDMSYHRSHSV